MEKIFGRGLNKAGSQRKGRESPQPAFIQLRKIVSKTSFGAEMSCVYRSVGNVHRHTVQCTLPLNLYNEMMFIFLWFWFLAVAGITTISLASWAFYAVSVPGRITYVRNRLMMTVDRTADRGPDVEGRYGAAVANNPGDRPPMAASASDIDRFVRKYLLCDGCFVLRLVASNSSDLIAAQLAAGLYDHYCRLSGRVRDPPADRADPPRPAATAPGGLTLPKVQIGLRRFPSKGDGMQG